MSLSAVHGTLSSLKSCQADLSTGMDIITDVAMGLMETQGMSPGIKELETMILDCAKLDREINYFVDTVQQVTAEVNTQPPEAMFSLSDKVKEQFAQRVAQLSDAQLHNHEKVMAFKESIKTPSEQASQEAPEGIQELDEDISVTQTSQVNFTCPLTQVDMVNPVRNQKCQHYYDEGAILGWIRKRHSQKKKCRCPVVGCGNTNVKESDLIRDQILKRKIQNKRK